jgi:hypothetical protein
MRSFGMLSQAMWTRGSGKRLRGNHPAQLLACYLTSCTAANLSGVYAITKETMASELGMKPDVVERSLEALRDKGFAHYDHAAEVVWIINLVQVESGGTLAVGDRRRQGILNALASVGDHPFATAFKRHYATLLRYPIDTVSVRPGASPTDTPSIPHRYPIDTLSIPHRYPIDTVSDLAKDTLSMGHARGSGSGSGSGSGTKQEQDQAAPSAPPPVSTSSSGEEKKLRGREGRKLRGRDLAYATDKKLTTPEFVWLKFQRYGIEKGWRLTRKEWSVKWRTWVDSERPSKAGGEARSERRPLSQWPPADLPRSGASEATVADFAQLNAALAQVGNGPATRLRNGPPAAREPPISDEAEVTKTGLSRPAAGPNIEIERARQLAELEASGLLDGDS